MADPDVLLSGEPRRHRPRALGASRSRRRFFGLPWLAVIAAEHGRGGMSEQTDLPSPSGPPALRADPLVSVVIPTHNRALLLRRTLESVEGQSHRPIEVIVIDDASEDDSPQVITTARSRLAHVGIPLHSRSFAVRSGPAAARNAGLAIAQGSLIGFLDSDDLWRPQFLSELVQLLARHPDCGVAFSGIEAIDADGRPTSIRDPGLPGDSREGILHTPVDRLVTRFPFVTTNTLIRRSVLDAVGPFDETLALLSDADVWYRIAKEFDFAYTREPLACVRTHSENITAGRFRGGLDWRRYQLAVHLRHVDDVRTSEARRLLVLRIQKAQVLLQEALLRDGRRDPALRALLDENVGPASARYRIGQRLLDSPLWLGRGYASAVGAAGTARRGLRSRAWPRRSTRRV